MGDYPSLEPALAVGGAISTVAGTALPWFHVNPLFDPLSTTFPKVYGSLAESGIHSMDLVILGVVGAVLVGQLVGLPSQIQTLGAVLGGCGLVLFCLHYPVTSPRISIHGPVVPGAGWYLTLVGGFLLTATGVVRAHRG